MRDDKNPQAANPTALYLSFVIICHFESEAWAVPLDKAGPGWSRSLR